MPDRTYMNSKLGKAYVMALEEDDEIPFDLPKPGESIRVYVDDIPGDFQESDWEQLKSMGYVISEPIIEDYEMGDGETYYYNISFPKTNTTTSTTPSTTKPPTKNTTPARVNTDAAERRGFAKTLEEKGFDPVAFTALIKAEEKKLKAGQKTNWKPGRLPNGGRIAADGTYIPPDAVREDVRKARKKK